MNRLFVLAEIVVLGFAPRLLAQDAVSKQSDMSLDSLLNIEVNSASKHWEKLGDAPASTTVITSEDIRSFGYRTLADVLAGVRGFYLTYDRNYTYVGARGFSRPTDYNDRILLLVNGHTMNDGFNGSAPFGSEFALDMSAIERIEIVRGPGSVLYGSGAMFAIVNVITVKGTDVDDLYVGGEVGTAGRRGVSLFVGGEPLPSWDALLSARWGRVEGQDLYFREYDSDSTNGGIAQNLDWDEYYGVFASVKHSQMTLQGLVTSRRKGIPTAAYRITFDEQHAQTIDRYVFLEARYDKDIAGANGVTARAYFDHYFYGGTYPYNVASFDANNVSRIGGEAQYDWAISSSNQLTGGMEMAWNYRAEYDNRTDEEIFFKGNFPYHAWSVYLQDEQQFAEQISLLAGVRSDARKGVGSSLSPRAALVYHPSPRSSVKLMFGNAFRFPNLYESEYYDELSNFKVNRDLTRERITTYEAEGSLQMTEELSGLATVYTYSMLNLIDQVSNPVDSSVQFQNVQKVQASGCEAELTARWKNGVNAYVSYVYENARDKDLGERLTNSPLQFVKCGCQIPLAGILRASFEVRYESARMTVMGTSTRPFWLTNVSFVTLRGGGNRTYGSGCGSWNASLLIKNLFNTPYEYPGGFEHIPIAAIAQDGREYTLRVEWGF